ncbi:hypothetical protein Dimus_033778 [Dionaea muscipula]
MVDLERLLCGCLNVGEFGTPGVGRADVIASPIGVIEEGQILDSSSSYNLRPDAGTVAPVMDDCDETVMASLGNSTQDERVRGDHPTTSVKADPVEQIGHRSPPPPRPWNALFVPKLPNGSIDLSNGFEIGIFYEAPPCLIGFCCRRNSVGPEIEVD